MMIKRNNLPVVLLVCDSIQRFKFMKRLAGSSKKYKFIYITGEPIVYLFCLLRGYQCYFASSKKGKPSLDVEYVNIKKSVEFLIDEVDEKQLFDDFNGVYYALNKIYSMHNIYVACIWNGQQLLGRAVSSFCQQKKIKKVFLEISNLPNKLFVDGDGVNALSSIRNEEALKKYDLVSNAQHSEWIDTYIENKSKPLPQSKVMLSDKLYGASNRLLKKFLKGVGLRKFKLQIKNKNSKIKKIPIDKTNKSKNDFIFLPLQVSSDTQVKLHSEFENVAALKFAIKYAKENGKYLKVKLHPAEKSISELDEIYDLQRLCRFEITTENTINLIKSCSEVITINSTVGLEAMIFNKKVTVLGRAFYSYFDNEDLNRYIHGFLINGVDYFANEKIDESLFEKIISRAQ